MNLEMMAPVMFGSLILFLLIGYPVAFALGAVGLLFSWIGIHFDLLRPELLQALPRQVFDIMKNDTLLAIPFFTFMGLILERSGMAEDMLDTIGQLFGRIRGGLAFAVIFVGALLAATTGVVAASVISMGLISLPIMLRYGYDKRIATGVIAASGTLAQIIPPSLVLIVLADQLGTSVGDMYAGAMAPGLLLCLFYAVFIFAVTMVRPHWAPALPAEARTLHGLALASRALFVMVPPLLLIFLVLGTIFLGIATPTEGGAMGAVGALILALLNRRLSVSLLKQAMDSTLKLSTFVVFILIGARVFRIAFLGVDGDRWVEHLLTSLPGGPTGFLIVVNLLVFFLAFFLDFFEIAFILVPLLAPVAQKLGIDLIWFGVILGVNMQTSFMHPPFGFALFYLKSVAPKEIKTTDIYWGAIPYVVIQLLMVGLIIAMPALVTSFVGHEALTSASEAEATMQQMGDTTSPASAGAIEIPSSPEESSAPAGETASDSSAELLKQLTGEGK
ncbi:TRAP transporter large permease [Pseudogulbenkiania subflava]|uniref:TRAP transporter large permease protein n=1 Tax=Pseudogulbenkiania subflava DSM 22618 TaxID=1123014 RepID=A0A1Y6BGU3_9NEIS|nr:TRAP transporter large permease subunit [Pseudogulbenkiania subflava]SMF10321.1 TRAP transporter, DctM subunit [Pseudogulbenkiania subflava DSM 22618]